MTKHILLSRGRWQLFHDTMSTSGGMYCDEDSYLALTFQVFHWDGISASVSILAPVIGDIHFKVQNKRSLENAKRSPYLSHNKHNLKLISWRRAPWIELVKRDIEIKIENERRRKDWARHSLLVTRTSATPTSST